MSKIIRYCKLKEEHSGDNAFDICRPSIFGNPFTHIKPEKKSTLAKYVVESRDEAVRLYGLYFDKMYEVDQLFRDAVDKLYEAYKKYDVIYLGCFCHTDELCHGDVIANKLIQRSMKENIEEIKKEREIKLK